MISDCGPDGGCEECDICRYLNFLEWAGSVGMPGGSTIERNDEIEAYIARTYPHVQPAALTSSLKSKGSQHDV
jgi:hypothetical protein